MQIAMIGLGRMGGNMVRRLMKGGHTCVVFDNSAEAVQALVAEGAVGASSLKELVGKLQAPRTVWVMVPSGDATEKTVMDVAEHLQAGDAIIDGGNSHFKDDIRRARKMTERKIDYLDAGTSGGVWGAERGYCLMVGGPAAAFERLAPIFKTLAPGRGTIEVTKERAHLKKTSTAEEGYLYCGVSGAGHFVKMIHNGIEYGMMQAFGEGLDILQSARNTAHDGVKFEFDLPDIAELWRRGSVVSSWLLDLTSQALAEDPTLKGYSGFVADSGEGRWTVETAIAQSTPAEVLTSSLFTRFRSRQEHTFAEKVLSAMRKKFGGHQEPK